ncbi:MAG: UDP-glucose/GDP-mannose dehydrogenase family protein [Alphaproteobacteria bacterium]|nr:MAG: UDP-glucose/GDP-mannose dehydrogenase family protein [Alphaproteobacteria bacterium]
MRVSVFGLGYTGSITSACLAEMGHRVIGVDLDAVKTRLIAEGRSHVVEAGLDALIAGVVRRRLLTATARAADAIQNTDASVVCVGTPSRDDGSVDLHAIASVCQDIGAALRDKDGDHVVIIRSTVPPGTTRHMIRPMLEEAAGKPVKVCFNPEFLREGSGLEDFRRPAKIVIGAEDAMTAQMVEQMYHGLAAEVFRVGFEAAEFVKYTDNVWHALKVAFANEIGNLCQPLGVDSHEVMGLFCRDTKLNISPTYLKPGFAFGGSCLPKELRAMRGLADRLGLELPVIGNVLASNDIQIQRGVERVLSFGANRIAMLGISFKHGTDDLRDSPLVALVESLLGQGCDVQIVDPAVSSTRERAGANAYIDRYLPHLVPCLTTDLDAAVEHAQVIVVGNGDPAFHGVADQMRPDQHLLDLMRVRPRYTPGPNLHGINW